jgi:hypothetical protein
LAITIYGKGIPLHVVEKTFGNELDVYYGPVGIAIGDRTNSASGTPLMALTSGGVSGMYYNDTTGAGSGTFGTTTITAAKWLNVRIGGTVYYVPCTLSAKAS